MTESSSAAFCLGPARQVEAGGEEAPADPHGSELAELREPLLALDGDAGGEDLLLEVRLELLDDEEALDRGGEAPDGLERQRMHDAELEVGGVGQRLAGADVGGAGGDDADAREGARAGLHARERARLGVLAQARDALEQARVQRAREPRQQAVLVGVPARVLALHRDLLADAHDGLLVRRLDREAHHHRHVVGLAELEGEPREVVALLAVGGLEHRHAGDAPEVAVVLLGHAAAHAGVAGDDRRRGRRRCRCTRELMSGSAATLAPALFIAVRARTPPTAAPNATS